MKWFVPFTAATCAAALVVMLPLALSRTSSPTRGEETLDGAPPVCVGEPSWFAPIHKAYDCNPRITPDFDFASLYSPDVNRLEASFTETAASITNRIGDLRPSAPDALGADGSSLGDAAVFWNVSGAAFALSNFPAAVFVAAVAIDVYESRLTSAWIPWAGSAVAAFLVFQGTLQIVSDAGTLNPIGVVAFVAFLMWVFALSVVLVRNDASGHVAGHGIGAG